MLHFFGRGSAFDEQQNSAFFADEDDVILIDCPMSSFHKLRKMNIERLTESGSIRIIIILVTHTHGDHVSGIATLIQYAFYVWHVPVVVAAPTPDVKEDLRYLLQRLEGCDSQAYHLTTADMLKLWVKDVIPTTHAPGLNGRCFGYHLSIDNHNVIYTGDTNTIEPYRPYFTEGSTLYIESSWKKSPVHIYLPDIIDELTELTTKNIGVYLMHLDNEDEISNAIEGTMIKLAPLYKDN